VNVVIVLGSERLYSDLSRRFSKTSDEPISIIKLDKSGGCVDRDEGWMKQLRANQIRSYFFGSKAIPLNPHTHWEDFSAVSIYRIIEGELQLVVSKNSLGHPALT
jgi:polyribonucleotide 5'-hydroxyl-kinase